MRIDPRELDATSLYRLMITCVVPRPIAWVSTRSAAGILNAAPFSYFQALSSAPPMVMISVGRRSDKSSKDTRANIEETGEFVVNIVSEPSAQRMVATAGGFDPEVSEFDEVGLEPAPSEIVKPPRIAESAVSMECKLDRVIEVGSSGVLIGEVVLFHIRDDVLADDGNVDPVKLQPLGRLGGSNYTPLREVVEIRPDATRTIASDLIGLWDELRERTVAMARALSVEQLGKGLGWNGMTVGRTLRHMAACTNYRVLVWEDREDEDEIFEWDESWTADRLAGELENDRAQFLSALAEHPHRYELSRMIRHEAWHQGQIAAALRDDFGESELWRL